MNHARRAILLLACLALSTGVMATPCWTTQPPTSAASSRASPIEWSSGSPSRWSRRSRPSRSWTRSGRQVDGRNAAVDDDDRKHLWVSMVSVPPGRYRVIWRVVSVDTHVTEGDFTFDVV